MILSNFKDRCSYCFKGLEDGLYFCSCNLSICQDHLDGHAIYRGCTPQFKVTKSPLDGSLTVEEPENGSNAGTLKIGEVKEELENLLLNYKKINGIYCPHYKAKRLPRIDMGAIKCSECHIKDNVWVCLECGNLGCGRTQFGIDGNGHSAAHYSATGHQHAAYIPGLCEGGSGEIFCYSCGDFITQTVDEKFSIEMDGKCVFHEKADNEYFKTSKNVENTLGICNEGMTCYVSSVLQLLATFLSSSKEIDIARVASSHYSNCTEDPNTCFCCYFLKIMTEFAREKPLLHSLNIKDFILLIRQEVPRYTENTQQDASEFLHSVLERLQFYEEAGLLENVTSLFTIEILRLLKCRGCGKKDENTEKMQIFYVAFSDKLSKAVEDVFSREESRCECGEKIEIQIRIKKMPKTLLLAVKRYEVVNGSVEKISRPISVDEDAVAKVFNKNRVPGCDEIRNGSVLGSIIHFGQLFTSGHYTWLYKKEPESGAANAESGPTYVMVSDENGYISSASELENGIVFLFKFQ